MTCARCQELQDQVDLLKARLVNTSWEPRRETRLTKQQILICQMLLHRGSVVAEDVHAFRYNARKEFILPNTFKKHIWDIRVKLKPFGISIHHWSGGGYYLTEADKKKLRRLRK